MKQLHEIFWEGKVEHIEEKATTDGKSGGKYIISGPFMRADFMNRNHRVYTKEAANKAISAIRPMVEEKRIRMLVDHPGFFEGPSLMNAGALLLEVSDVKEDGYAYYKAQILDTDVGKNLKAILDAGSPVGVSTRGYVPSEDGCEEKDWLDSEGNKHKAEYIKDWVLESVDFVDDPAVLDTEIYMKLHTESLKRRNVPMTVKTVEEMKSAYPELCKELTDSAITDTKNEFEPKVTELESQVKTANESAQAKSEALDKLVESVRAIDPSKFTVIDESEAVKAKDSVIAELNTKLEEANKKIEALEKELKDNKAEAEKNEKESYLETLKVSDPDFFTLESFKNVFDNCITKEDVKTVYENNSKIVKEMKEKAMVPAAGKSIQTDESSEKKDGELIEGLTPTQYEDFKSRNEMRRLSNLEPMTTEKYLAMFGASTK